MKIRCGVPHSFASCAKGRVLVEHGAKPHLGELARPTHCPSKLARRDAMGIRRFCRYAPSFRVLLTKYRATFVIRRDVPVFLSVPCRAEPGKSRETRFGSGVAPLKSKER